MGFPINDFLIAVLIGEGKPDCDLKEAPAGLKPPEEGVLRDSTELVRDALCGELIARDALRRGSFFESITGEERSIQVGMGSGVCRETNGRSVGL